MANRFWVIAFLSAFFCLNASAQTLSLSQQRKINVAVLGKFEEYALHCRVHDKNAQRMLSRMFTPDAEVFCDLQGSSEHYLKSIPHNEYTKYAALMCDGTINPVFTDFRKRGMRYVGGRWHCTATVNKTLSYVDNAGVLFPIGAFKEPSFRLEFDFVFEPDLESCRIAGIRCLNASEFLPLEECYIVEENKTEGAKAYDHEITIGGAPLEFFSQQAYSPKGKIDFWDDDVKVKKTVLAEQESYSYIQFEYAPKHLRLKVRNGYAPFAYNVQYDAAMEKPKSWAYEGGLDFGYSFGLKSVRGLKLDIYTGLAVSLSSLSLQQNDMKYSYSTTDSFGKIYNRKYELDRASQSVRFMDLMVPLYMSINYKVHPRVVVMGDVGVKAYFNTNAKVKPFHIKGEVSGQYLDGTIVEIGKYGIGFIDESYNEFISAVSFKRNSVDATAFVSAGIDCLLGKDIYLEAKIGYEHGLTQSFQSAGNKLFNPKEGMYPLVYSCDYDRDIVVRPFADCVSFRRQALWLNLGFMFKF